MSTLNIPLQVAEDPAVEPQKPSPAISILTQAFTQVDEVLNKAEQTLQLLQSNLQQVTSQRIALAAQKQMLSELITKIKQEESK